MKIKINETVDAEFDSDHMNEAAQQLTYIRDRHNGEALLDALFVILAFRAMERAKPGAVNRILGVVKDAATE